MRATAGFGHSDIDVLMHEYGLPYPLPVGNLTQKAHQFVHWIRFNLIDTEAESTLLELAGRCLSRTERKWWSEEQAALEAALALEGFAYSGDRLIPAMPGEIDLSSEITELEEALQGRFPVAANHYRQAVDSYVDGNHEAANGQVRPFLEDLFMELDKHGGGDSSNASSALQHMKDVNQLDNDEWQLMRGLWATVQDKGPHRGLSDPNESLFRLHFATAAARYLLAKETIQRP